MQDVCNRGLPIETRLPHPGLGRAPYHVSSISQVRACLKPFFFFFFFGGGGGVSFMLVDVTRTPPASPGRGSGAAHLDAGSALPALCV